MASISPHTARVSGIRARLAWVCAVCLTLMWTTSAVADQRAMDATVLVRVIGDVTALQGLDERFNREKVQISQVELGTGSGIVISPTGYILTNLHVIDSERKQLVYEGVPIELMLNVTRIDVQFPSRGGAREHGQRYAATVVATDAELDLAVLFVNGTDLPFLPLGDSDAVQPGRPVSAIGYPLGRSVDLANPDQDAAPSATVTTGTLSAVRRDVNGDLRYLQTSATVNPGNSGGALVDEDGYVVGVVELKMKDAKDIGFAIPIGLAKEFLVRNGLDRALPVPLLPRNVRFDLAPKGLRFMAPESLRDTATSSSEVWSARSLGAVTLRIGRITTPSTAAQLETALLGGRLIKSMVAKERWSRQAATSGDTQGRLGKAVAANGNWLVYLVLSRRGEAVVAFYEGPADDLATNESLLLESLQSVEVSPLAAPPR